LETLQTKTKKQKKTLDFFLSSFFLFLSF